MRINTNVFYVQKLYLASIGGGTIKEIINQFLRKTLSDELVKEFTWTGVGGTRSLYNSDMGQIYFGNFFMYHNFILKKYVKKEYSKLRKFCV